MKKNLPDSLNPEYWVNSGNTGYAADAGSGASISRMIMKLFAGIVAATVVTTALVFVGSYYNAGNVANAARVIGTHHQKNQEPSKDSVQTEEEEEELEEQTYSDGMENTDKAEHVSSDARKSSVSDVSENDMTGSHESESRESMDFRGKTSKKFKKSESQTKVLSNDPYDADARDPAGPNVVVRKIDDLKPNSYNHNYDKAEKIRLQNISSRLCSRFRENDLEKIFCDNPNLMLLEEEYLNSVNLSYDDHGCLFGCPLNRSRLNVCKGTPHAKICVENYFETLMAEDRIQHGMEDWLDFRMICQESGDNDAKAPSDAAKLKKSSGDRGQKVLFRFYSTTLPIIHFTYDQNDYSVYGYPQYRGEYFRDNSNICIGCDFNAELKIISEKEFNLVIKDFNNPELVHLVRCLDRE